MTIGFSTGAVAKDDCHRGLALLRHAGAEAAIEKLQTLGVITAVESYRSIVRLRNLIVHEYEEIDPGPYLIRLGRPVSAPPMSRADSSNRRNAS